jgi:hypothetical protein
MIDQAKAKWFLSLAAESISLAENATEPSIKQLRTAEAHRWLRLAEMLEGAAVEATATNPASSPDEKAPPERG